MKKSYAIVCLMLIVISCNYSNNSTQTFGKNDTGITTNSAEIPHGNADTIVNDNFIGRIFDNDFTTNNVNKFFPAATVERKLRQNIHDDKQMDTTVAFTSANDTIVFYHSPGKSVPEYVVIHSAQFTVDKDIKVGTSKDLIANKFSIKNKIPDTLVIQELEGSALFSLYFTADTVSKIRFVLYLD